MSMPEDASAPPLRQPDGIGGNAGGAAAGTAGGDVVMRVRGLARSYGPSAVLSSVDLVLRAGESVVVFGRRNAGKTVLARILAGLVPPDAGSIDAPFGVAPPVGVATGFGATGTLERDLGLRAAAHGLDTGDFIEAASALLDDPNRLDQPFGKLDALNRATMIFGASYLVPAGVYVADGAPVPIQPGAREVIAPLYEAARQRAGVISFASSVMQLRDLGPDRVLLLERGRLEPLGSIDEAIERFAPGRQKRTHESGET